MYSGAVLTMRNYYNKHMNESSLEYLRSKQVRSAMPKVVWLPLGTTKLVPLPRAAMHELFQDRPLLWSWAGSVNGRPERDNMIKALKESDNSDQLLALGKLVEASDFAGYDCGGDASLSKWEYSALLHNTKFMPLPSGVNPEQYRIWEAIEAGCIPIVLTSRVANDGTLYPLRYLGFEYLELDEWGALPGLLWQLYDNFTRNVHRYQSMSEHNSRLWLHIKNRIANEIADVACSEE